MAEHRHHRAVPEKQPLYGLAEQADLVAAGLGRVVLVEGPLDAVAVSLTGHVGLAAGGTALTPDHATQLRTVTTTGRPLHVAYDGDPAGQAATVRAALTLAGAPAVQVFLQRGEDPASILNGHGPRGLRRALTATRPLVDAAVDARLATWYRHLDTANVSAAVDAVRHVAPLFLSAPAGGDRSPRHLGRRLHRPPHRGRRPPRPRRPRARHRRLTNRCS